jgi:hypothetical protein
MKRITAQQAKMLGLSVKNSASSSSKSGKVNDRERRSIKRSDRCQVQQDIKAGLYSRAICPE